MLRPLKRLSCYLCGDVRDPLDIMYIGNTDVVDANILCDSNRAPTQPTIRSE